MQEDSDLILDSEVKNGSWSIRPCNLYKGKMSFSVISQLLQQENVISEEYRDCRSIKGRFQQYFVHGDSLDCSSWEHDFENCVKFEEKKDLKAAKAVIDNETSRRKKRMKAHFGNNVWKKRDAPPEDWSKPLPDHLNQQYENSFLDVKSKELRGE